jgi:hypothetical protein
MLKQRTLASAVLVPVLMGSIGLIRLTEQARFETYRTVDVLQLLGSGMCFGIALSAVVALLRGRRGF